MLILETVKCTANIWMDILYLVIGLIVGVLAGFFISKKLVSKQLKENNHDYQSHKQIYF